jgi:hypothetical protein
LQGVGVLVLVDQDVVGLVADEPRERSLLHHVGPVEEQVVVIEDVLPLLGLDVGTEEAL